MDLQKALAYAPVTPAVYRTSLLARNKKQAAVFVNGQLALTTGWADDQLSREQSRTLAESDGLRQVLCRILKTDALDIRHQLIEANDIDWQAEHQAIAKKPRGHVVTDDAGEPAPLLAIVHLQEQPRALAMGLCVMRDTSRILAAKSLVDIAQLEVEQ